MQPDQPRVPEQDDAAMPDANEQWQQPAVPVVAADVPTSVTDEPRQSVTPSEVTKDDADDQTGQIEPAFGEDELIRWQATEHIHREKRTGWYLIFGVISLALFAVAIFLVKSLTFAVLIPVMAAALVIYTQRPPATIDYTLDRKGLFVNDRLYEYGLFKEFSLVHGDDEHAIRLVPHKRFQPGVMVYFPVEAGEAIVDMLAARLPMHETQLDFIDRLIRTLRI